MIERWSVVRLSLSSLENIHLGLTEWCLLDIVCVLIIPLYLYILWNVSFFYSHRCWPSNLWWLVQRDPLESKKEKSLTEKLKNYECMGYTQAGTEKSRQFKTKLNDFLHEIQALECEEQAQVARFLHGKFLLQLRQQRLGSYSRSWLIRCIECMLSICYQFTTYLDSQMDKKLKLYEIKTERWFWYEKFNYAVANW